MVFSESIVGVELKLKISVMLDFQTVGTLNPKRIIGSFKVLFQKPEGYRSFAFF
jgi:hypothetical protein